ncbi:unnamed protein product [Spirodela intermedia]|uniref:Gamma-tubulin complex component n=1 Tax=Spirodela intermedia TaxID=51605 RepID=A0A7I8IKR4_SPIIN|nr:unnamed protein product [Spirodela intermedia]CAA6658471.1 unnamed protein product [Spirodela intermedia]
MEGGELDFVSQLLRDLRVDRPWVPPKTWESIPSESGRAADASPAYPPASAGPEFMKPSCDPFVVSETVLVRLVLNALQGVKSALVDIDKASSVFASSPADRTFHQIPNLWHRSSSMLSLGRLLKSIGYSGLVFFLLRKFVNHFLGTEQSLNIPHQDKNIANRNQYGNEEFAGKPPYTIVNQAFAVAVRKILEGYLCALNTIFASVKFRRSLKGVDESELVSHKRIFLLGWTWNIIPSKRSRSIDIFVCSTPSAFDLIGLGYKVDWPISIIVTQDGLKVYSEIFSFLLDVRLAVFSLSSMWRSLKALGHSNASGRYLGGQEAENFNTILGIRQQVNHFVSSLQQYLQSQLSDVSWFCNSHLDGSSVFAQVNDMLDLESVHMSYLADAQNTCFLSAGTGEIAKIIRNILQCAVDLRACLKASPTEAGLDGPDSSTVVDRVNFPKALAVQSAFKKNLRELYLHYLRSPKHSEFSLCRFWCCLDYNRYYSNEISRGTGG